MKTFESIVSLPQVQKRLNKTIAYKKKCTQEEKERRIKKHKSGVLNSIKKLVKNSDVYDWVFKNLTSRNIQDADKWLYLESMP